MVFTNVGKSGLALAIGSYSTNRPQYMAIGSGSGAVAITNIALIHETNRTEPTITDVSTIYEVAYTADWNSVVMSGTTLKEFGMFTESVASTGSCWNREAFAGVEFDGSNELQIQLKFEIY